ncbi:MAG: hypothetical protein ABIX46_12640 [Burkholderiaceae bacterium]
MQTRLPPTPTPHHHMEISPPMRAVAGAPLAGIERIMADALDAFSRNPPGTPADPGAIEYASWLRLLHRTAP